MTRFQTGVRVAASENVTWAARANTAGGMNCVASWSSSAGSALWRSLAARSARSSTRGRAGRGARATRALTPERLRSRDVAEDWRVLEVRQRRGERRDHALPVARRACQAAQQHFQIGRLAVPDGRAVRLD